MTCRDWRGEPASSMAPVYAAEIDRWSQQLSWDTRATWDAVEDARRRQALPGLVLCDGGRMTGWTFFLPHRDTLQIGAFASASEAATTQLLDGILASDVAHVTRETMLFAFSAAPALTDALLARGFDVEPYHYLERALDTKAIAASDAPLPRRSSWRPDSHTALTSLLARAYGQGGATRPFARANTAAEWREYVDQLVATPGCGVLLPAETILFERGSRLDAAVVTTRLASRTAHIAQVAVDPSQREKGLGRRIVEAALERLASARFARVTLLVGDRNIAARTMYEKLGFVERATFVSAGRTNGEVGQRRQVAV